MKKFSILSLTLLLAAGVGVAGRPQHSVGKHVIDLDRQISKQFNQVNVPLMAEEVLGKDAMKKAPKKTPVVAEEVSNLYVWNYYNVLEGDRQYEPNSTLQIDLVDAETGLVEISGWYSEYDFKAIGVVDYEAGTLSIPNYQEIGEDEYGPLYFYLKPYEVVGDQGYILEGMTDAEATVGYFNGTSFEFDPFDLWTIGDPEFEGSELMIAYANSLTGLNEEQEGQWEYAGECTMVDAWITPGYQYEDGSQVNPNDYPFTVELQRNIENENLYRLWRPYHSPSFELAELNESVFNGQIVIDLSNPDYVSVKPGYFAGFANQWNGEFCVFNLLGWQISSFGEQWDPALLPDLVAWMKVNGQPVDSMVDNVLTVNLSVFDVDISCTKAYNWGGYTASIITFPTTTAVGGVEVDNAPVKYYNLQGVEVANPAAGELVICRQGDKATKKIMK